MQALVVRPVRRTRPASRMFPAARYARARCPCGRSRSASAAPTGRSRRATSACRPDGDDVLVLGHEFLGRVERDGHGFTRGDLVTSIVRRSCSHCLACNEGAPDSCLTGDYSERGITRLHGFARELVAEDPAQLIAIPGSLGRLGVLVEPASICERGIRHARTIGGRQPWELAARPRDRHRCDRDALDVPPPPCGARRLDRRTQPSRRFAAAAGERVGRALRLDGDRAAGDAAGGGRWVRSRGRGDRGRPGDGRQHRVASTQRRRVPTRARRTPPRCRARRTRDRRRRSRREPRRLRQRQRAPGRLARRRGVARARPRALARRGAAVRRPACAARPVRGGVRPHRGQGNARARADRSGLRVEAAPKRGPQPRSPS